MRSVLSHANSTIDATFEQSENATIAYLVVLEFNGATAVRVCSCMHNDIIP